MKNLYFSDEKNKIIDQNENLYIPVQYSDYNFSQDDLMKSKYKINNIKFDDWKNYFDFKRDKKREQWIYKSVLKLEENDDYCLINKTFATPPNVLTREDIIGSSVYKNVLMRDIGYDNIFDWLKVIENAKEIHTVETSVCYLIEKLDLKKCEKLKLYSRNKPERGFAYVDGIYKKEWEKIL